MERHANIPNWVSAIAAAVGCVAAIVFGVLQLADDGGDSTSAPTPPTPSDTPFREADLEYVGDEVVRVRVPAEWDQRRSYINDFSDAGGPASQIKMHSYVASSDAGATSIDDFYDAAGVFIGVSPDVQALGLEPASVTSDAIERLLRRNLNFGHDCDPQFSRRVTRPPGSEGVQRHWHSCGPSEAPFIDGLLVADDSSYFVYFQFRAGPYGWEDAVDTVLASIEIDRAALDDSLADVASEPADNGARSTDETIP